MAWRYFFPYPAKQLCLPQKTQPKKLVLRTSISLWAPLILLEEILHHLMYEVIYLVVSNIFYFHPYLGKWSNLTNIFQRGWNHQLDRVLYILSVVFFLAGFLKHQQLLTLDVAMGLFRPMVIQWMNSCVQRWAPLGKHPTVLWSDLDVANVWSIFLAL